MREVGQFQVVPWLLSVIHHKTTKGPRCFPFNELHPLAETGTADFLPDATRCRGQPDKAVGERQFCRGAEPAAREAGERVKPMAQAVGLKSLRW
jgi:hypothetical protein